MKRSRKADFAARPEGAGGQEQAKFDPRSLSEEEKIERVLQALRDGRETNARKRYEEALRDLEGAERRVDEKMEQIIEHIRDEMPAEMRYSSHMTAFHENANGTLDALTVWHAKASEEVCALMEQLKTAEIHLLTGLQWAGLSGELRLEALQAMGQSLDLATASSVLEVLPEASRNHALRWQREINQGSAWVCSASTGEVPRALIDKGYCMQGKVASESEYHSSPGRDDLSAGSPGTPSFVRAIMGEAWLVWLQQQE